jgi:hypothetical protein
MSDVRLDPVEARPRTPFKRPVGPDAILMPDGQKLVRATKAQRDKIKGKAHAARELLKGLGERGPLKATVEELTRAAAVEGEALKKRRAPMPKTSSKGAWPKVTGVKAERTKRATKPVKSGRAGRVKEARA